MAAHIHVVTDDHGRLPSKYLAARLAEHWRDQGHRITVGPCRRLDADLGLLHIDRTWVPDSELPENPGRQPLLNIGVLDISKRRISTNLVSAHSDYAGPVIVKTNANSFGTRDVRGSLRRRLWLLRGRLAGRGHWTAARRLPPKEYPIFDNPRAVPKWIWRHRDLVVERFLPEMDGDEYSLRVWMFLGDRDYGVRLFSRHPVVKTGNITRYEYIHEVPDRLRQARADLGIDYAKFDYVIADGRPVLLDVNTTPVVTLRRQGSNTIPRLAGGVSAYLR